MNNNEEVNKIIAEYMGLEIEFDEKINQYISPTLDRWWHPLSYTSSLDSLIPVWEKLTTSTSIQMYMLSNIATFRTPFSYVDTSTHDLTITEAAAHATAKCIMELNKGEECNGYNV